MRADMVGISALIKGLEGVGFLSVCPLWRVQLRGAILEAERGPHQALNLLVP